MLLLFEKLKYEIMILCIKFVMFEGEFDGEVDVFVGIGGDLFIECMVK